MAELKTSRNDASVLDFIHSVENDTRRKDSLAMLSIMEEITGSKPAMWGPSVVGFGHSKYVYKSGRTLDWFLTGFSPRKQSLTLYIMSGFKRYEDLLAQLGKYKTGKSCLYINKLEDVDEGVLRTLIQESVDLLKRKTRAYENGKDSG